MEASIGLSETYLEGDPVRCSCRRCNKSNSDITSHRFVRIGASISKLDTEFLGLDSRSLTYVNSNLYGRGGFTFGLDYARHPKNDALFVMLGIHYHAIVNRIAYINNIDRNADRKSLLQMFKLPLTAGANLAHGSGFLNLTIRGGLVVSYVLAVGEEVDFGYDEAVFNDFHVGGVIGVGVQMDFISLDITNEWGFTNMIRETNSLNNVITLTAGMVF